MPSKTSINYLFPPDRIHDLPTWRFVLHFQAPRFFAGRAVKKAVEKLKSVQWKALQITLPLDRLSVDPETGTLDVPVEVPETVRRSPSGLADYESDVWKLYAHLVDAGFGDLYYEAVDWDDQAEAETEHGLFLHEEHPLSHRSVVLEEENGAAWMYLTFPGERRPEKDALAYSLRTLITTDEAIAAARSGGPPPLSAEFASPTAVVAACSPEEVRFLWSGDGGSVALILKGEPRAMIVAGSPRGYSKALCKEGFYGVPWDDRVYAATFMRS